MHNFRVNEAGDIMYRMRNQLLWILALLIMIIAVLHIASITFYLYWTFWWFDIVVHFLGGLWAGLALYWLFYLSGYTKTLGDRYFAAIILLGTLAVGAGWEIFEYALKLTFTSRQNYILDTEIDMIMDMLGAFSAWGIIKKMKQPWA